MRFRKITVKNIVGIFDSKVYSYEAEYEVARALKEKKCLILEMIDENGVIVVPYKILSKNQIIIEDYED